MSDTQELKSQFEQATIATMGDLSTFATTEQLQDLSQLTLPEITTIADLVAKVIPAGNLPGMILNGLARLSDRKMPIHQVRQDIDALFKGVDQFLDKAVYAAFFAGPAAIIWGYQNMLKLTGRTEEDAFPYGIWQFYVDYAMREDTARHTNETHGFQTTLLKEKIQLDTVERLTAWTMTAIETLHHYDDLLENEWYERLATYFLTEVTANTPYADRYRHLYRDWEKQRPYALPAVARQDNYPDYRQAVFEDFLQRETAQLDDDLRRQWEDKLRLERAFKLKLYQKQMTIHAYLHADTYNEEHRPLGLREMHIAIIYQGHYYLIPICKPNSNKPAEVETIRSLIAALVENPSTKPPANLMKFVQVRRTVMPALREKLHPSIIQEIDKLKTAPIIINADVRPAQLSLSEIRLAERGAGDHAITIFDTGKTTVFDQSHIFFDGAWGSALAEIMTNEAIRWARKLYKLPAPKKSPKRPYRTLIYFDEPDLAHLAIAPKVNYEATAENDKLNLKLLHTLRRLLQHRNEKLQVTINDLMILYRAIHAAVYEPSLGIVRELKDMERQRETRSVAVATLKALDRSQNPPAAVVIPIDASKRSPRDRLYPMAFSVPLADLKILDLHEQCLNALDAYQGADGNRAPVYQQFHDQQLNYLAMLAGFGTVLNKAKEIANNNETVTAATARLMGDIPMPLMNLLNQIPERFDILNDIIKGREIFSNVGQVVPTSTLVRFNTAKDDTDKKTLCWGVLTDASGVVHLSLRDFRPHVGLLEGIGRRDLAQKITQDYLDKYVEGLNKYIRELKEITEATRETIPTHKREARQTRQLEPRHLPDLSS